MATLESWPRMYEDLANHYARHGESRQRDNCLVLAAATALSADMPDEAERLRKRLLMTNPHHLLRPYNSMTEAMQADDIRDFVSDLRRLLPPETVAKLLNQNVPPKQAAKETAQPPHAAKIVPEPESAPSALAYALSLMLVGVGVALATGLLFTALIWPLIE